ncbi:carbon-nitrogen hydrolase [Halteromyces radiatus]|uniref:carbon-nitrogen hydrolase n=1 Tax=Halteromyces radiatus TaxID=101107 RepID=UPI00221FAD64|nr:carbon-nitrogen hydrolase [Halteromyces radiatus]KAI8099935.1 carbon-nitrogen hydrolase [Halteromyces radiatus]
MTLAAIGQFCASSIIETNKIACCQLMKKAAQQGAKMLFLPEASDFISETKEQAYSLTESIDQSSFIQGLRKAAQIERIWVSVGIHEKCTSDPQRIYNTHVVIDDQGQITSKYQKIHLFDVDIKGGPRLMESDSTKAGENINIPIKSPLGVLGLQICYDLRFAELSIQQRRQGAHILTFPSAFTVKTGMAHWETLLRARAIETQCYVIASAQIGQHNQKRISYGNSMIVDPWGTVLARCPDLTEPTLALASIDLDYLNKIRTEMPVMNHRRNDIYPLI